VKLRRNAKVELLRAVPLFSSCTTKELGQISALGDELHQPEGSELITEGVKGREFFVLIEGTVEARRNGRRVATFEAGDFFGEIALLTESPRTATVVAQTPVRLLVISGQSFRRLLGDTPSIQGKVLAALAERMKPAVA
jgi:CRP-like cAMP-binding protein